jgi:hypothetical protein
MSEVKKILFFSANPKTTPRLRIDREVREIEEGLRRSRSREQFEFKSEWAVHIKGLRRALLDQEPYIVHFTGHGSEEGIYLEDEMGLSVLVNREALSDLFGFFKDKIKCVLLNACFSKSQANDIAYHIDHVIGMKRDIPDSAATEFAVGFYDALGAGRSIEDAFRFGIIAAKFEHAEESTVPKLIKKREEEENMNPGIDKANTIAIRSLKGFQDDVIKKDEVKKILDLTGYFEGRYLHKGSWEDIKQEITSFLKNTISAGKEYNFYIPLHCSLAFFAGRVLPVKYGAEINIYQPSPGSGRQLWQRSKDNTVIEPANEWNVEEHEINNAGSEIAVALSVTHDIRKNVESFIRKHAPNISRLLHISLPNARPDSIKNADHAFDASYEAVMAMREAYRKLNASRIHLFMAAPNVFSFHLGQHSILLRNITMYEYDMESGIQDSYFPGIQV